MKSLSHNIILFFLFLSAAFLTGCQDDFEFDGPGPIPITGEEVPVALTIDFMPAAQSNLTTRSDGSVTYPGDGMRNVDDLCLVIFDHEGKFYEYREVSSFEVKEVDRTDDDASNGQLAGETATKQLTFNCELPRGTFYLYALANMGSKSASGTTATADFLASAGLEKGITTREQFLELRKRWDSGNIANNSGMTGYFTEGKAKKAPSTRQENEKMLPGELITVNGAGANLHCWLRRMASKLTLTIDSSGLSPDVYVYIRDVRLHSIPYDCNLFGPNEPGKNKEADGTPGGLLAEKENTQIFMYCEKEDAGKDDLSDIHSHYEKWPCFTAYDNNFSMLSKDFPNLEQFTHAQNAPSLFFYENMQGQGESKLQDADFDGKVDSPDSTDPADDHYRDGKPYGTYIEVTAYYVSRNLTKPGNGVIKYRFMLGKNIEHDYDSERNFHYKLTLRLLGYANEVDWHIDYNTNNEKLSIPNPYYISYSYNEKLTLPIVVYGDLKFARATIVRNDWEPSEMWLDQKAANGSMTYYTGALDDFYKGDTVLIRDLYPKGGLKVPRKTALGFLSLRKPDYDAIGMHFSSSAATNDAAHRYLWRYYSGCGSEKGGVTGHTQNEKRNPLFIRTYSNVDTDGTYGSDALNKDGQFKVTRRPPENGIPYKTTLLEVPLYTRERNLVKTTGLTGANPYESYQRRAQVRFDLQYERNGTTYTVDTVIDVIQVVKIANPRGVWRSWDNARPFKVSLNVLNGNSALSFQTLESRGSWSAEVEVGADWILLNGNRAPVYGNTGSPIQFEIKPIGLLANANAEPRCGIVKVKYHNYTCTHRIFVRQGFAPLAVNEGDGKWHSFNLETTGREVTNPLDEGSLFKYGGNQAISSYNNVNDKYPWVNVVPGDFVDHSNDLLLQANLSTKRLYKNINKLGR